MDPNQPLTWPDSVRRSIDEAQRALDESTTRNTARNAKVPGQKARILSCVLGRCDELRDVIGPIQRSLEQAIADHPIKAVVLSLATGVFLGWLIKR